MRIAFSLLVAFLLTVAPSFADSTFSTGFPGTGSSGGGSGSGYTSPDQVITTSGSIGPLTHGLGVVPASVVIGLVCQTGEQGYSAGDITFAITTSSSGSLSNFVANSTTINGTYGSGIKVFGIFNKSTLAAVDATNANWKMRIYASTVLAGGGDGGGGGSTSPGGTSGQSQYNNAGSFGGYTVSGDGTLNTTTGTLVITKTNGSNFAASATTDTTSATNISSGTLAPARMATFTSSANGLVPASGGGTTNFLRADGTFAAPSGGGGGITFGGDGSSGAVTKGAVTETTIQQYNATTFTQTAATTYTVKSGTQINASTGITINGTFAVSPDVIGPTQPGATTDQQRGNGLSGGGRQAVSTANGGAGGGFGGAGGNGGTWTGGSGVAPGGQVVPLGTGYCGSSGSSAGFSSFVAGGPGGGYARLCSAGTILIASGGSLTAIGGAGNNADSGSGAGSGGGLYLYSSTAITQTGTGSVQGGAGGTASAYGGGGGGGAGYYLRQSPSNTGAGTITTTGGAAGSGGGSGTAGAAGGSSTAISITGTPNYPLMAEHLKRIGVMVTLAQAQQAVGRQSLDEIKWTQKDNVSFLSAMKGSDKFESNYFELNNGEELNKHGKVAQIGVGDALELGDAA